MLAAASLLSVTIDYRYDTNNFFNTQEKRDRLQEAADMIVSQLGDDLAAITPGGTQGSITNRWSATFFHPGIGSETTFPDLTVGANEIIVFAGGRNLGGTLRGLGGRGGFTVNGTAEFVDLVETRGENGSTSGANATEYAPWGGAISFTTNSSVNWYFGETTAGLTAGKTDFLSVALHEMMHVFGFGTADSWERLVDGTNRRFTGSAATAAYDGVGNPPLSSELTHWSENTMDDGRETAMDPTLTQSGRKLLTGLDLAALEDIGWQLVAPEATSQINFTVVASATSTTNLGEVSQLPTGITATHEWKSLLVEVWMSTPESNSAGIREASIKLFVNPDYYRVANIEPGPAFTADFDSEIDSETGRTTLDGLVQSGTVVGASGFVLLARVQFQPTPTGKGVALDFTNVHPAAPAAAGWISLDASTSTSHLTNGNEADVVAGSAQPPKLWPVLYDLSDDGQIGFGDLALFSAQFLAVPQSNPTAAKSDFDQSGSVGFGDFSLFAANFLKTRSGGAAIEFPAVFAIPATTNSVQAAPPAALHEPAEQETPPAARRYVDYAGSGYAVTAIVSNARSTTNPTIHNETARPWLLSESAPERRGKQVMQQAANVPEPRATEALGKLTESTEHHGLSTIDSAICELVDDLRRFKASLLSAPNKDR